MARKATFAACLIATATLTACKTAPSTKPLPDRNLLQLACPENLGPLADDSFGSTSVKLLEVIGVYRQCRAAALAEPTPSLRTAP